VRLILGAALTAGLFAACSSFTSSDDSPTSDGGVADAEAGATDAGGADVDTDAGSCGEPVWATPDGGVTKATCGAAKDVDLLSSDNCADCAGARAISGVPRGHVRCDA